MIRCVRLWTGEDSNSHFEEGIIDLTPGGRGDKLSDKSDVMTISFQETASGRAYQNAAQMTEKATADGTTLRKAALASGKVDTALFDKTITPPLAMPRRRLKHRRKL
jgi:fumarate hydratase class II